jgi:hypothetical protein
MKAINSYYYLVYFRDFFKPIIYPVYFINKAAANRALKAHVGKKKRVYYQVVRGEKLQEFEFKHLFTLGNLGKFTKYAYTTEMNTKQKRKNFRTILRRRLRRMGMLTLVKNKQSVRHTPQYIKVIKNRQMVAANPYTLSNGFRLERKPKHIYYLIIEKAISKLKGVLWEMTVFQVDMKSKSIKTKKLKVKRNDVVIPHLLTEIIILYGNEEHIMDAYRAEGIRFNHPKQKDLLTRMRKQTGHT